jgi:hypothetical protein
MGDYFSAFKIKISYSTMLAPIETKILIEFHVKFIVFRAVSVHIICLGFYGICQAWN